MKSVRNEIIQEAGGGVRTYQTEVFDWQVVQATDTGDLVVCQAEVCEAGTMQQTTNLTETVVCPERVHVKNGMQRGSSLDKNLTFVCVCKCFFKGYSPDSVYSETNRLTNVSSLTSGYGKS